MENDSAIICSSMPACASFTRETLLRPGFFASFGSRFASLKMAYKSKTGGSDSKLNDSHSTQAESADSKLSNYVRLKDQIKPNDTLGPSQDSYTATYTTKVFSDHTPADVEMGVIKKSVNRSISYQGPTS